MGRKLTPEQIAKFESDGFLVIPDFVTAEEIERMKSECAKLIDELKIEDEHKALFVTGIPEKFDEYFLGSSHKIRYFFEKDALNDKGELIVEKENCLNKIGHALHSHNPVFKEITLSEKMQDLSKDLGFIEPVVLQGMYIFKNPNIGGEVACHQDASFLYNEPVKILGYWLALEDATTENGCLWFLPGSHKGEVYKRYIRDSDDKTSHVVVHEPPKYSDSDLVPGIAPKGSCVLLHGKVLHKSEKNLSDKPRPTYTFHIAETKDTVWSDKNWLKPPTKENPFLPMFTTVA